MVLKKLDSCFEQITYLSKLTKTDNQKTQMNFDTAIDAIIIGSGIGGLKYISISR